MPLSCLIVFQCLTIAFKIKPKLLNIIIEIFYISKVPRPLHSNVQVPLQYPICTHPTDTSIQNVATWSVIFPCRPVLPSVLFLMSAPLLIHVQISHCFPLLSFPKVILLWQQTWSVYRHISEIFQVWFQTTTIKQTLQQSESHTLPAPRACKSCVYAKL